MDSCDNNTYPWNSDHESLHSEGHGEASNGADAEADTQFASGNAPPQTAIMPIMVKQEEAPTRTEFTQSLGDTGKEISEDVRDGFKPMSEDEYNSSIATEPNTSLPLPRILTNATESSSNFNQVNTIACLYAISSWALVQAIGCCE